MAGRIAPGATEKDWKKRTRNCRTGADMDSAGLDRRHGGEVGGRDTGEFAEVVDQVGLVEVAAINGELSPVGRPIGI